MPHPIEGIMSTALENIKKMTDVNTIIGTPITTPDGTVIIPVSRVAFGFCAGGSEFGAPVVNTPEGNGKFGGGSGAGVSITPVAFLVVNGTNVRLISMSSASTTTDKIVDMIPEVLDKFSELISGSKKDKKIKYQDELEQDFVVE